MEIKDAKGRYNIKVDTRRNIVYETQIGYWKPEDLERFHDDYINKISPLLEGRIWSKCCDLRNYKTSMITVNIQNHIKWAATNGLGKGAILLDAENIYNSVIELQMNAAVKGTSILLNVFTSIEEADKWLEME